MKTRLERSWVVLASLSIGCLPADLRPEPARVVVDVDLPSELRAIQTEPNQITFTTGDGWQVTLDRFFVSMGDMMLQGPGCSEYASAWYGRVLDLSQPGPQRLGQLWGINGCRLTFEVFRPADNAVLGAGVTQADRDFMRHAVVPSPGPGGIVPVEGMVLHMRGSASKAQASISFDWGFATGRRFGECRRMRDGDLEQHLPLVGGETTEVTIGVDPRELFVFIDPLFAQPDSAQSLIQAIADADQVQGNANGRVAMDELLVPTVTVRDREVNMAEVMRIFTFPSMFNYGNTEGSQCQVGIVDDDR
jgi:hypothetical protein